jgi:hypothetical protein
LQLQADELTQERKAAGRPLERLHVPGHSHPSEACAIGTADDSLPAPVLNFNRALSRPASPTKP